MKWFIIIKNNNIKFIKNKSSPLICRKRYIKIWYKYYYTRRYKIRLQTIPSFMKDCPPLFYGIKSYPIEDWKPIKFIVRSIWDTSPVPPNTVVWYEGPTAY